MKLLGTVSNCLAGRRRLPPLALLVPVLATMACGSLLPAASTATPQPAQPPTEAAAPPPTDDGLELVPGGFDISRVRLMDPTELPEGVPVPVPFGGEIDPSLGAFEGELLAVEYDGRFYPTAVAYYATWIEMEAIEASPLFAFGGNAAGWELIVDGQPVRIELSLSADGETAQLLIYWGS